MAYETSNSGALSFNDESKPACGATYEGVKRTIHFNAANSNNIYGASNTVQPPALCLIPQIRF